MKKLELRIKKYISSSKAQELIHKQKLQIINNKLASAQRKMSRYHQLVFEYFGQHGLDEIYDSPFRDSTLMGTPPADPQFDSINEEITMSTWDDNTVDHQMWKIRQAAKKKAKAWRDVTTAYYRLKEIQEINLAFRKKLGPLKRSWYCC